MAHITTTRMFGNTSIVMTEYLERVAKKEMTKIVKDMSKAMMDRYFLPVNIKAYVSEGAMFDFRNPNAKMLGVKCDGIYLGSGWGLLKIAIKDIISDYKFKLKTLLRGKE